MILFRESLRSPVARPFVLLDQDRLKYIEGLRQYREDGTADILTDLIEKEADIYAEECRYFFET